MESRKLGFRRLIMIFSLISFTLVTDQLTKIWARNSLGDQTFSFLGNSVVFQRFENPGAFLSLGADLSPEARLWIFTVGIAIFSVVALFLLLRMKHLSDQVTAAYSLFIAGGVSNLIDRVMKGTVTDFMNLGIGWLRTGIFNIADVAIMIGVALLIFQSSKRK
jgi:signal peptidase II